MNKSLFLELDEKFSNMKSTKNGGLCIIHTEYIECMVSYFCRSIN